MSVEQKTGRRKSKNYLIIGYYRVGIDASAGEAVCVGRGEGVEGGSKH